MNKYFIFSAIFAWTTVFGQTPDLFTCIALPVKGTGEARPGEPSEVCPYHKDSVCSFTLNEAEAVAEEFNHIILSLKEIVDAGRYAYFSSISQALPSANFEGGGTHTSTRGTGVIRNKGFLWEAVLTCREVLFSPDVYYGIRLSKVDAEKVAEDLRVLRNEVLFTVRSQFYRYELALRLVSVAEENIALLKESLDRELARIEEQQTTVFAVNQSQTSLANAYTEYYEAARNVENERNALFQAMGLPPQARVTISRSGLDVHSVDLVDEKIRAMSAEEMDKEQVLIRHFTAPSIQVPVFSDDEQNSWITQALQNRPEIQRQRLQTESARLALSQRKAAYLPSVEAFASYGRQRYNSLPGYTQDQYQVGFTADWQLFDSLGRKFRVDEAKKLLRATEETAQQLILSTRNDVSKGFTELTKALRTYLSTQEAEKLAELALEAARQSRELGAITGIEYRETAANLNRARRDFSTAAFDLLEAYYFLSKVSGRDVGEVVASS